MAAADVEYCGIPEFPGYRAGNDGSIWSCWRRVSRGYRYGIVRELGDEWKQLKLIPDKRGRLNVHLCRDGRTCTRQVHRLVLLAFVGPCPEGMEACHWDGNTSNNALSNLRWDTKQGNAADKRRHGTHPTGERNPRAKLTRQQVKEIRRLVKAGGNQTELAKRYGIARSTIGCVVTVGTWKDA
jgi:hypothetical protein